MEINKQGYYELYKESQVKIKKLKVEIDDLKAERVKTEDNFTIFAEETGEHIKELEEKARIYNIQIWAAMKAQSLGLCKKCLSHAIRDLKALEGKDV